MGFAVVISETFFASNYPSVWRSIAPSMDDFVRRTNLNGVDREWPPLRSTVDSERRGAVNEAAYLLFAGSSALGQRPSLKWLQSNLLSAFMQAVEYSQKNQPMRKVEPNEQEVREIIAIYRRLDAYFSSTEHSPIVVRPHFKGCGILNSCTGDVFSEKRGIYEIKSGDRPFRSIDYRQLSVYLGLYFAETRKVAPELHLLNPRTGLFIDLPVSMFTEAVSGRSAVSYCQAVVECFSANLISE